MLNFVLNEEIIVVTRKCDFPVFIYWIVFSSSKQNVNSEVFLSFKFRMHACSMTSYLSSVGVTALSTHGLEFVLCNSFFPNGVTSKSSNDNGCKEQIINFVSN